MKIQFIKIRLANGSRGVAVIRAIVPDEVGGESLQTEDIFYSQVIELPPSLTLAEALRLGESGAERADATLN